MPLVKVSELEGAALDWAVAKIEGKNITLMRNDDGSLFPQPVWADGLWQQNYSTSWAQGGPIIEREGILLRPIRRSGHAMDGQWLAMFDATNTGTMVQWVKRTDFTRHYLAANTPLIAAMRCYVASKLGESIEIPKELV